MILTLLIFFGLVIVAEIGVSVLLVLAFLKLRQYELLLEQGYQGLYWVQKQGWRSVHLVNGVIPRLLNGMSMARHCLPLWIRLPLFLASQASKIVVSKPATKMSY